MKLKELLSKIDKLKQQDNLGLFIRNFQIYGISYMERPNLELNYKKLSEDALNSEVKRTYLSEGYVIVETDYYPDKDKYEFRVKASNDWYKEMPTWCLSVPFPRYTTALSFFTQYVRSYSVEGKEAPRVIIVRIDKTTKEETIVKDLFDTDDDRV